jgi:large subunit ribosomal protein L10
MPALISRPDAIFGSAFSSGNPKREENRVNRSEKSTLIGEIKTRAASSSIAVVTDFKGMSVEELTRLRVKLREAGGT